MIGRVTTVWYAVRQNLSTSESSLPRYCNNVRLSAALLYLGSYRLPRAPVC